MCGGGVDSSAAHAGSEVVRRRAALEHEYELQHAQMEIARLSVALKLSEAANDGLRDANNKLRMLLYKRTAGARDTETNANTLVQPSRKKRKVSADKYQYVGKCSHHMHERARAQEAAPDRTQTKLTIHYFSSIPTRPNSRCTLPVPPEAHVPQVPYGRHQTKMLEELYFEGKLESREGRAAAVVSVSGLSTPDGLVVGRLVTIGAPLLLYFASCCCLSVCVCPPTAAASCVV